MQMQNAHSKKHLKFCDKTYFVVFSLMDAPTLVTENLLVSSKINYLPGK